MSTVYDREKEFHLQITPDQVGKYVLLCGDPARCEKIAACFDEAHFVHSNREYTIFTGKMEGEDVTVCSHGIGGPSTAICLEELVHCGCHTFIRVGTSGGMAVDVMGGDVVIGTGAIRMEGTSKEYAPIEYPAVADYKVVDALVRAAKEFPVNAHVGVLQCKDSFYGQHDPSSMPVAYELKAKWDAFLNCGALASEMESAALFIIAGVRKVRAGSIMAVFANQTRRELGLEDPMDKDSGKAVRIAVEAMRILIREDRNLS
ncbi:MAG: uridine phosphorylase [Blautia sp.]|nr:uridine phosphorylase [Blautia sp.]